MGATASADQLDTLLKDLGTEFGLGLDPEVALQVAGHLPQYAAAHDRLRQSGSEAIEAMVKGTATTYLDHIRQMGVPDDREIAFLEQATQSCNETMKLTMQFVDERDMSAQQSATVVMPEVDSAAQGEWLARKLADPDASDAERTMVMLRHASGARDFVRLACENGFSVNGEDALGVEMSGPDSVLRFTVLASRGADTIHTLSIKEGDKPAKTLVDNGELVAQKVTLKLDEPDVPEVDRVRKLQSTDDSNPLVLAVHAGDADAVRLFLDQGWSSCAAFKNGSLITYAADNGLDDVAAALNAWRDQ